MPSKRDLHLGSISGGFNTGHQTDGKFSRRFKQKENSSLLHIPDAGYRKPDKTSTKDFQRYDPRHRVRIRNAELQPDPL